MKTTTPLSLDHLRRLVCEVPLPSNLFQGLLCRQSLAPDNIIFFRRGAAARSIFDGVSSNYHHRFEFVVVAKKSGPVRIDQKSYLIGEGECALIFPNQFHHYLDLPDGDVEWLFLTFDLQNPALIEALRDAPRELDSSALALVALIVREFLQPAGSAPDALSISYHLSRLLLHLLECPELPETRRDIHAGTSSRDVILDKINRHLCEHLTESLTIADLAHELGYSVSHLRAVFRDRLGVSLGRYMRESRLSEAAQLLQTSQFNISAIGDRCGFESLYAFSRAFRKAYGVPPRAYRQLVVEGNAPLSRRQRAAPLAA